VTPLPPSPDREGLPVNDGQSNGSLETIITGKSTLGFNRIRATDIAILWQIEDDQILPVANCWRSKITGGTIVGRKFKAERPEHQRLYSTFIDPTLPGDGGLVLTALTLWSRFGMELKRVPVPAI
jgi:hypothetical protein